MSEVAKQHSAAASFAGFLFQLDLALLWLSQSEIGSVVGIETLDDVVLTSAGTTTLGQSKLSYRRNPLTDLSPNLWKTISIWLKLLAEDAVDLDKTEFLLISNFRIETGIIAAIKSANQDARKLKEILKQLTDLARNAPEPCKPFATELLSAPKQTVEGLLSRLRISDGVPANPAEQLPLFAQKLNLAPSIAAQVVRGLRGWVQEQAESKFALLEPALLERDEFCEEHHRLVTLHFDRRLVLRAAEEINVSEAARRINRNATFVQQLRWIDAESDEVLDAIDDYLRSADERTRLADENNITDRAFSTFENNLVAKWKNVHRQCSDRNKADAKLAGRETLRATLDHREMLDGQPTTEFYLTRGTYHKLANGKQATVGWHPQFRKILAKTKP